MTFDLKKRTVCEIDVDIINQYGICVYVLYTSKQIPARLDYVSTLFSVYTFTCGLQWFRGARKLVISTFPCGFLAMACGDREVFLRNYRLNGL